MLCMAAILLATAMVGEFAHAAENKDVILVLDTSLSMIGKAKGAKDIMSQVKQSLKSFIGDLKAGDTLTFMTFDEVVRVYPIVNISNANDTDIIDKYISMVEAKGKWTYTLDMLSNVLKMADDLEVKNKNRQKVIVIMTDGLDDPPPGKRKARLSVKDVAKGYSGKDWFIYLVNLGDLKKNEKLVKFQRDLSGISPHTKVIDAGKDAAKGIQEAGTDINAKLAEKTERERPFYLKPWFFAIIAVLIILIVVFLIKRMADLKVKGKLQYWNHELLDPYIEIYDLSRQNARVVPVGRGLGCLLNIRDFDVNEPFRLVATRIKGKVACTLQAGETLGVEYVNREKGESLQDGDIVKIKNYTFKYLA